MSDRRVDLRVLGPLQVVDGPQPIDVRGDRVRALLAVLLRTPDEVVANDVLVEALWGDAPPATANAALRMHASRLRQRLGPAAETGVDVVSQASGYRLAIDRDRVDHVRFERLLAEARGCAQQGDARGAVALLQECLDLWRGPAFADVDVPALSAMARHLEARQMEARDLLFATRLGLGDSGELVADLEAAVAMHPEHERLTGHLMLALYRSGRQTDALAAFQRLRTWLADELGLTPSVELSELEARILRQDPNLLTVPAEAPRARARAVLASTPVAYALPSSLGAFRRGPFVGREREVEELITELRPSSGTEASRLHCLIGPAGIGKSRLLAEVGGALADDGVVVLHGWAAPGAPLPFGALRTAIAPLVGLDLAASAPAQALIELMDDAAAQIEDRRRVQLLTLLDGLADALAVGGRASSLLVLDDVQWADSLSLTALHHLARRATPGVGLLAAARTGESAPAWNQFSADLSTIPGALVEELSGLDLDAVAALVEAHEPSGTGRARQQLAQRLVDATKGNPFYVTTMLEGLLDADIDPAVFSLDAPKVPVAAAAAIQRRVRALPARTRELLGCAAVIGATFSLELLAEVDGAAPGSVEADLHPAVAAGVVAEGVGDPDELSFDHDLVRRAVLDNVAPGVRRTRHRAVAHALRDRSSDPIAVAFHLYRCMPLAGSEEVLEALQAAAARALDLTAWEEAKTLVTAALEVWANGAADDATHIDLLVAHGRARMGADGRDAAMHLFEEAFDLALDSGHGEKVDDVLLAATRYYAALTPGDPVLEMIDRALRDVTRVQLGVRALTELVVHRCAASGASEGLVAMVERLRVSMEAPDESEDLVRAEMYLRAGHPDVATSLAISEQVVALNGGTPDEPTPNWLDGRIFTLGWQLLAGEVQTVVADLPAFEAAAEQVRLPVFTWLVPVARASLAQEAGRFDEAADWAQQALVFGTEQQVPDTAAAYGFHLLFDALFRGGVEEQLPVLEGAVAQFPTFLAFHAGLTIALARSGRADEAALALRETLDRLAAEPRSLTTPVVVGLAAWTAADLGDPALGRRALRSLDAWSGTAPRTGLVAASCGPIDRSLGRIECMLGQTGDGVARLRSAVALADRMGSRVWSAWCRADLVELTADDGEADAAREEALDAARELGLQPLLDQLDGGSR